MRAAGQQQVYDVCARDEQYQRDASLENEEDGSDVLADSIAKRGELDVTKASRRRCTISLVGRQDHRPFRDGLLDAHARPEQRDGATNSRDRVFARLGDDWHPELGGVGMTPLGIEWCRGSSHRWKPKPSRHDADHAMRAIVEHQSTPDDAVVRPRARRPGIVAQDDDPFRPELLVFGDKRSPSHRANAERGEQRR